MPKAKAISNQSVSSKASTKQSTVEKLQQQLQPLTQQLAEIDNFLAGQENSTLKAISQQRWYYFKDKTHVLYDSHTGYLWPNLEYVTLPKTQEVEELEEFFKDHDFELAKKIKLKSFQLGSVDVLKEV